MRHVLIALVLLTQSLVPKTAIAEQLRASADVELVRIMNRFYIIAELDRSAAPHFGVRILGIPSDGECGAKPETCPKEQALIAISGDGEYPFRELYLLPEAFGWKFGEWQNIPKALSADEFVEFTMIRTVVAADQAMARRTENHYRVRVNLASGHLDLVKSK